MNVLDVIRGQVSVSTMEDKDRYKNLLSTEVTDDSQPITRDSLTLTGNAQHDLIRVQELQKNYLKNEVTLNGLQEMQTRIAEFEDQGILTEDWSRVSDQLGAISRETMFDGESVISYMSTNVEDERSLYTLKMNLQKEVENVESQLNSGRREIAMYLISRENQDAQSGFNPETVLQDIISELTMENAESLHGPINNVNNLLSEA